MTAPTFAGFSHGQKLEAGEALTLLSSPGLLEAWAIVPGANGRGLTLMLRSRATAADLERAHKWARSAGRSLPRPFGART